MNRFLEEWRDWIRYHHFFQTLKGIGLFIRGFFFTFNTNARLDFLANAYRVLLGSRSRVALILIEYILKPWSPDGDKNKNLIWYQNQIGWNNFSPTYNNDGTLSPKRLLILKKPGANGEKGILFVSIESALIGILLLPNVEQLVKEYKFVFASTWSPPSFHVLWALAGIPEAEIHWLLSNKSDSEWIKRLWKNAKTIPLYISSWSDPADFNPKPREERDIDLLMVANWASFKRHWLLFSTLKNLPKNLRIVLIGQPEQGRTVADIQLLCKTYNLPQKLEFYDRLPLNRVMEFQCRSHASIILARREGACAVVAESLFSDTPVGLLEGAHIGSSDFINTETGSFLRERHLANDLTHFINESKTGIFKPRDWAINHISYIQANKILETCLMKTTESIQKDNSEKLAQMKFFGGLHYANKADANRFSPAYKDLEKKYNIKSRLM